MKERRAIQSNLKTNERRVEGYAIVFDSESQDLGGFTEIIKPEAVDEELLNRSDIKAVWNHSTEQVPFARNKYGEGSLSLTKDEVGLRYSYEMPDTALGNEVLEAVKRGDVDSNSFVFSVADNKESQQWSRSNGKTVRTITKFERLFDVSLVSDPAYLEAKVNPRGLKDLDEKEKDEAEYRSLMEQVDNFKKKHNEP